MFKRIFAAAVLGGALLASGCETDGMYAGGGYYGGYYTGYYDDFYGPVSYGYWGPDNYFYYSTTLEGPYVRDEARHFRRERWEHAHQFRMRGHRDHDHTDRR